MRDFQKPSWRDLQLTDELHIEYNISVSLMEVCKSHSHNGLVNVAGETGDVDGAIDSVES